MPFTPYRRGLDPETLHAAYEAFVLGCADIQELDGYDVQLARNLLAKLIVEAALKGERDPDRLKGYAVEGLSL